MVEFRRYLTQFDATRTPHILTDVLIIGSGIAGLRAALAASAHARVLVVSKARLEESNTWYAQGGIAASMADSAARESHVADTLAVSCGLGDAAAITHMVQASAAYVEELVRWGVAFDRKQGAYHLTREGGHATARVLHANGDATGEAIVDVLLNRVRQDPNIRCFDDCFVIDLLADGVHCSGAITYHPKYGHQMIWAKQTVLASGGCGRVYRETTNPAIATGDGHAMAFRAGVVLQDMEMVQFHPTTLYIAGASRALISEAVRGEGGLLVDKTGQRFMAHYHPQGELAPRDVVSRAIVDHMVQTSATCAHLDVRHFEAGRFASRFPGIFRLCTDFGIDPTSDLIPVRPSAHYMIGGAHVDVQGRTSLEGLWACGEAAGSGVHGANRLASNSLLEGVVFGAEVGTAAARAAVQDPGPPQPMHVESRPHSSGRTPLDLDDVARSLRSLVWRNVGIERAADRLTETIEIEEMWAKYVLDKVLDTPFGWEVQNMLTVSMLMARAARYRTESRGVHFRTDFPDRDDDAWSAHVRLRRDEHEPHLPKIFSAPVAR